MCPSDSIPFRAPASGHGFLLGSQLSIVDQSSFQTAFGPLAGYYRFKDLNDHLTLQVEFQAKIVSGYHLSANFEDNVVNPNGLSVSRNEFYLRSLFFLEMPVLVKIRRNPGARFDFFAGIRPSLNAITNHQQGSNSVNVSNGEYPNDLSNLSMRAAISRFDLGLIGGFSYAFSPHLSLDLRYTHGLVDLTADNFFKSNFIPFW